MRANEYAAVAELLKPRQVLLFDNPCVGEGPRPDGPLTILDQALHQWEQIERVVGLQPVHIFGLSMGGMIGSTMASIHPERTASLIVAATSPNVLPSAEAVPSALETEWLTLKTKEDLARAVDIAFGKTTKESNAGVRNDYFKYRATGQNLQPRADFAKQLAAVRGFDGSAVYSKCRQLGLPTLLVAGEEDELFPSAHSSLISSLLGVGVDVIAKAGHMLHVEAPRELAQLVSKFIARVED